MRGVLRGAYGVLRGFWSTPAIRQPLIVAYDALATATALFTALALRFEGAVPAEWLERAKVALPILVGIRVFWTYAGRLHRWSFRVCGLQEALRLSPDEDPEIRAWMQQLRQG